MSNFLYFKDSPCKFIIQVVPIFLCVLSAISRRSKTLRTNSNKKWLKMVLPDCKAYSKFVQEIIVIDS